MGYDTGLLSRIAAKGVPVVAVAGWETRGSSTYTPLLALHHHTAGAARGATPSLNVCIYGRSGLPGPLCQVLQSREPDGRDRAYVIAAGRANHAGIGAWRGISGNSRAGGVEVEHTGTTTVDDRRIETTCRILAALLEGGSRDARNACQHFEYAQPPGRKIDFAKLGSWTTEKVRARVAYWIGRTASGEEEDMTPDQDRRLKAVESGLATLRDHEKAHYDALNVKVTALAAGLAGVDPDADLSRLGSDARKGVRAVVGLALDDVRLDARLTAIEAALGIEPVADGR